MSKTYCSINSMTSAPVIGYCLSNEKFCSMKFHEFLTICCEANIKTVEINEDYLLNTHLRQYEEVNIIIHKLASSFARDTTENGADAPTFLMKFEQMVRERSQRSSPFVIVDDLEALKRLCNRDIQYTLLSEINDIYIPPFVIVKDEKVYKNNETLQKLLDEKRILYPIICKPIRAHGPGAHNMKIIFDQNHLHDITFPCILQKFINHDGILIKTYLLGQMNDASDTSNFSIVYRNSVNNFSDASSRKTLSFTTKEVCHSKPYNLKNNYTQQNNVDKSKIRYICENVQNKFQLNLMGIDVIIDCVTNAYAVIDVNYFPGYDTLSNVNEKLLNVCLNLYELQFSKNKQSVKPHHVTDSNKE